MTIPALLIISILLPLAGGILLRNRPPRARLAPAFAAASVAAVWGARTLSRVGGEPVTPWVGVDGLSGVLALAGAALCLVLWAPGRNRAVPVPAEMLSLQAGLLAVLVLRDLLWVGAALALLVGMALGRARVPAQVRARGIWLVGVMAVFGAVTAVRTSTGQQAALSSLPIGARVAFNRLLEQQLLLPDASGTWGYPGLTGWSPVTSELSILDALAQLGMFEHPLQQAGNLGLQPLVLALGWLGAFALVASLGWTRRAPGGGGLAGAEVLAPAGAAYLALRLAGLFPHSAPRWPGGVLLLGAAAVLAFLGWRGSRELRPLGWAGCCIALATAASLLLGLSAAQAGLALAVGLVTGGVAAQWMAGRVQPPVTG